MSGALQAQIDTLTTRLDALYAEVERMRGVKPTGEAIWREATVVGGTIGLVTVQAKEGCIEVRGASNAQIAYVLQQLDPDGSWSLGRVTETRREYPGQSFLIPLGWAPGATVKIVLKLIEEAP